METPTLTRVPSTDHALIIETLHREGAVVADSFLDPETISAIKAELQPELDRVDGGNTKINDQVDAFFGESVKHISSLTAHSPTFANQVLPHPVYRAVCDEFLLPNCASYVLNLAHLMDRGPGAEAQMAHRDAWVWPHLKTFDAELQVTSIIALVDFTKENGATGIVPFSHTWEDDRYPEEHEAVYAEIEAGDALLYLGSTYHFGGANTTEDQWRPGVHLSYTLGWLRTEENNYLGTPPSVARKLSRDAQALIGYAIHDAIEIGGGYLGMVDMQNPMDLLASDASSD